MANSVDPEQTAPIGAVCSGSTLFASILNSLIMLGNYLQQTTSADDIFRCISFLRALRVNLNLTLLKPQRQVFKMSQRAQYQFPMTLLTLKNNIKQYGPKIAFLFIFSGFIQNYLMNMTDLTILNHQYKTIQLMITKNTQNIIGESFQD